MKNLAIILLVVLGFTSCKDDKEEMPAEIQVNFEFSHFINGEELELDGKAYTLPSGESFIPSKFKYYISNITFENSQTGNSYTVADGYYLIDEAGKKEISLEVPTANYDKLSYYVGIDKARNLSTDQVGDLDPNNDMVWSWKTGYKFLVLEGEWEYQTADRRGLVVHIGNNDPESEINFKEFSFDLSSEGLSLGNQAMVDLDIEAEISSLFTGDSDLVVHELESTSIMGGPLAITVANNYQKNLFSIK
ncbi:hypothetical protein CA2015_0448 [Cyclobacterium amurskyense]|uniref:Copper-binding protein MbnP-like domain-containing protein n=2 Tax=Cyclobacterium amurskyense TaxID=320787 RepID=A0A0H4PAY4_9BACT|nr:hypothetical protein CA2015_0448 [Cyclobacterium amurskyense]